LTDLTVSGATTATVIDTEQRMLWWRFPPQVPQVPRDVDLVTVTAGGNDLDYVGSMIRLAYAGLLGRWAIGRPVSRRLARGGVPRPDDGDLRRATAGLVAIVAAVRERAPDARVLLVDYPTILGPDAAWTRATPFDPGTRDGLREVGRLLAVVFRTAAQESGAELVAVSELGAEVRAGAAEPWVRGFLPLAPTSSFHPTLTGMRAVADAIADHLAIRPRGVQQQ
jgi:lysophospholipase L1-like esterase